MNELDLGKIDCDVIGTNLSYEAREADIQVFTSGRLMKEFGSRLVEATPGAQRFSSFRIKGCFQPRMIWKYSYQAFLEQEPIPELPENYDIFGDGWILAGGAPCALQVAASQGYGEIVFLGLDLSIEKGYHFYPEATLGNAQIYKDGVKPYKGGFRQQAEFFRHISPWLARRGIRVYNTCFDSLETTFEKREFSSFWR